MGLSVWNQVDTKQYFSISTIDKKQMKEHGIEMTIAQLQEIARRTDPYAKVMTGSSRCLGQHRMTKIYRYKDFATTSGGENMK